MKYFISDLIVGMKHFAEFADWIESSEDPDLGIEFTAFTHDEAYWQALAAKVPQMTVPWPFMGRMWTSRRPRTSDPKGMYGLWKAIKWWQSRPASGLSPWNGRYSADHALGREIYRGRGHRYRVWIAWKADTCRTSGWNAWIEKLGGRRKSTFLKSYQMKAPEGCSLYAIVFGCFCLCWFCYNSAQ